MPDLSLPLLFKPVYQRVLWGGRRMGRWRDDLPDGPIGESWDLADHERGMSVVVGGPWQGATLRELARERGTDLVGGSFAGGDFPLMVKLIDASDRLSVQVHPDDALAARLGAPARGKTECWLILEGGGEIFLGTRPGVTRASFERALADGVVAGQLNRIDAEAGDFFLVPARTVHALGGGCLLYEVQQTSDTTYRVDDWGRLDQDGRPRPLHRAESLATIDWDAAPSAAVRAPAAAHSAGGSVRRLADCAYFAVEERQAGLARGGGNGACSVVVCLAGSGRLATAAGEVRLEPMRTALVPASAGPWRAAADRGGDGLRLLVAQPA